MVYYSVRYHGALGSLARLFIVLPFSYEMHSFLKSIGVPNKKCTRSHAWRQHLNVAVLSFLVPESQCQASQSQQEVNQVVKWTVHYNVLGSPARLVIVLPFSYVLYSFLKSIGIPNKLKSAHEAMTTTPFCWGPLTLKPHPYNWLTRPPHDQWLGEPLTLFCCEKPYPRAHPIPPVWKSPLYKPSLSRKLSVSSLTSCEPCPTCKFAYKNWGFIFTANWPIRLQN